MPVVNNARIVPGRVLHARRPPQAHGAAGPADPEAAPARGRAPAVGEHDQPRGRGVHRTSRARPRRLHQGRAAATVAGHQPPQPQGDHQRFLRGVLRPGRRVCTSRRRRRGPRRRAAVCQVPRIPRALPPRRLLAVRQRREHVPDDLPAPTSWHRANRSRGAGGVMEPHGHVWPPG